MFMFVCTMALYEYMNLLRNVVYNLFVNTHAFSRGCCKVNGTAVSAVCGGLLHLRKYYFLRQIFH